MTLTINTNISSLITQRNLNNATNSLNKSIERMTTGYKINQAKDNAAGYSISNMWETQIGTLDVAADNAATGADLLTTAEQSYGLLTDHLQRIRDLTEQAANGTYGTSSMVAIKTEVLQRMEEINRLCKVIDFNGIQLLDGTSTACRTQAGLNLQVSNNSGKENIINLKYTIFQSAKCTALFMDLNGRKQDDWYMRGQGKPTGDVNYATSALYARITGEKVELTNGTVYDYSDKTQYGQAIKDRLYDENDTGTGATNAGCITAICDAVYTDDATAREFLQFIDEAIENVSNRTTLIGAYMNRVESAVDAISVQKENIVSANSSIKDADVATESSNFIKYQILQQSTATLLSTANQTPSIALNLI